MAAYLMAAYRGGEESNPELPGSSEGVRFGPDSGDAGASTRETEVMDGYPEYWIG